MRAVIAATVSSPMFMEFEMALVRYSGDRRKLIHEKNPEVENLLSDSL
jgi:hypothetical protein